MPLKQDHILKAQANEAFALSLDDKRTSNIDWIITALFYSAIHYVEAYLANLNIHPTTHRARDSAIERDLRLKDIFEDYGELKNYSINARYYMVHFSSADVSYLISCLNRIKSNVASLL